MSYYPVFLQLSGKKVLVLGGGIVAQRKIESLIRCGASILVISRDLSPFLQALVDRGAIKFLGREFDDGHLCEVFLVIAATSDSALNSRVAAIAEAQGILVNAVDQPEDCNFIVPSIIQRGDLMIAISTSGKSPALAKRIRQDLDSQFGQEYESFLNMMGRIRKELLSRNLTEKERTRIFHNLVDSPIMDLIKKGDFTGVKVQLERIAGIRISLDELMEYFKDE